MYARQYILYTYKNVRDFIVCNFWTETTGPNYTNSNHEIKSCPWRSRTRSILFTPCCLLGASLLEQWSTHVHQDTPPTGSADWVHPRVLSEARVRFLQHWGWAKLGNATGNLCQSVKESGAMITNLWSSKTHSCWHTDLWMWLWTDFPMRPPPNPVKARHKHNAYCRYEGIARLGSVAKFICIQKQNSHKILDGPTYALARVVSTRTWVVQKPHLFNSGRSPKSHAKISAVKFHDQDSYDSFRWTQRRHTNYVKRLLNVYVCNFGFPVQ